MQMLFLLTIFTCCGCTPGSGTRHAGARNQPLTAKIPPADPYLPDLPKEKWENTLLWNISMEVISFQEQKVAHEFALSAWQR